MFLRTLEELSGTFGLGRDGYLGTCDGYRGTLGTYPWDVQIMVGLLQFGTIGFWNMVRNGAISGRPPPPVDRDNLVMGLYRDIDWDDLVMGLNGAVVCEGLISGCPPPPPPPPPLDRDDLVMGLYWDINHPPQPGDLVYTISWLGHRITNVRVIVPTSVVLLFAHKCLSIVIILCRIFV